MIILYVLAIFAALLLAVKLSRHDSRYSRLPPRVPWALPFVGHLLYLGALPCKVLLQWKQIYGPVFMVQFGSFRTVVFNDAKSLREAFKIPGMHDRPPIKQYLLGAKHKGLAFINHGSDSEEQRNFVLRNLKRFNKSGLMVEAATNDEISKLVDSLAANNNQPIQVIDLFSSKIMNSLWTIIMGYAFNPGDPEAELLLKMIKRITGIPGVIGIFGMYMPWLSNLFPKATEVTSWVESYNNLVKFVDDKTEERNINREKNNPRDILDAYLDKVDDTTDSKSSFFGPKNFLQQTLAELLVGAGDTTSVGLEWAILLLTRFENIQTKLQQEISNVVTTSRFPYLSDRQSMPYTEAFISEIFRYTAFAPMALPHYTNVDIETCGYFIPKDTLIFQNTYAIFHDPTTWEDPEEFRPERFLNQEGEFRPNDTQLIFGYGKRYCLGETVARDQMFLFITRIVQRFNVRNGPIVPSLVGEYGVTMHPKRFEAVFIERN